MIVYIDPEFRCHAEAAEGLTAMETDFFEGKCKRFIEGYRYVPAGAQWLRADGAVFSGPMVCPAEDFSLLNACQKLYEQLQPELNELRQKLQNLRDCLDGLSTVPSLEQLQDFLLTIKEMMEDD